MEWLSTLVWLHRLATLEVGPGELLTLLSWAWWIVGGAGVVLCLAGWLLPALLDLAGGRLSIAAARVVGVVALAVAILLLGMDIAKHGDDAQHKAEMAQLRQDMQDAADRERARVAGETADALIKMRDAAEKSDARREAAEGALHDALMLIPAGPALAPGKTYGGGWSPATVKVLRAIGRKK